MKELETERLLLRPWRLEDAQDLFAYASDPRVGPNVGFKPLKDLGESLYAIQMLKRENETWALEHRTDQRVIGSIGLHEDPVRRGVHARMLVYVVAPSYWGQGLAVEAGRRALEYAFDGLGAEVVSVYHYKDNARSQRVSEKLGFAYEGMLRKSSVLYDGTIMDDACYSMTREEWEKAADGRKTAANRV